ncbi:LAMI_0B08460g1_1 [Lachancea mirantina]|uniref:LAMI_0B08460g1_1 n=1 Tax=Lachancea mirantina TaxID=1230905 RepID=A0A1G4IY33_9SACH|nr:LAMI_0B08460g1_1 [Lachancea mirantina]
MPRAIEKKRKNYSRNGCSECRQVHIKCDEVRPQCRRCERKNLPCTYETKFIFQKITPSQRIAGTSALATYLPNQIESENLPLAPEPARHAEYSVDPLGLSQYIYISPSDLEYLNTLQANEIPEGAVETAPQEVRVDLFDLKWRSSSKHDFCQALCENDFVARLSNDLDLELDPSALVSDQNLINFTWTVARNTFCAGNFAMFPDEHLAAMLTGLVSLSGKFSVVQSAIMYDCAMFMRDLYQQEKEKRLSLIWDRFVRIPCFKKCLEPLSERLEQSLDYDELVALTFVIILLFSANSANRSNDWRIHLTGCYQLIAKLEHLKPDSVSETGFTSQLHDHIKDWFCHAQIIASISSDNGGAIGHAGKVIQILKDAPYSALNVLDNRMDLLKGYQTQLYPILTDITFEFERYRADGVLLGGSNILKFKLENADASITRHLHEFGENLIRRLNSLPTYYSPNAKGNWEIQDFKLQLSFKRSSEAYRLALELYVKTFFFTSFDESDIDQLFEKILEALFSMPYLDSVGMACHWPIYASALASIYHRKDKFYFYFIESLLCIGSKGFQGAFNSIERLSYLREVHSKNGLTNLINSAHDFTAY